MAKLHKFVKGSLGSRTLRGIIGKDNYDSVHPLGTQAEAAYDAKKESEKALATAEEAPVIPMADEQEIERARRRRAQRKGSGRASTILTDYGMGG